MAVLLVLLILVLGYRYCTAIAAKKAILKRSSGWESYVLLGNYGLGVLWLGFVTFMILVLIAYGIGSILSVLASILGIDGHPIASLTSLLWYAQISGIDIWVICVGLLSILMVPQKVKSDVAKLRPDAWITELRKLDAITDIVLYASFEVQPVKISLKTKKVYVGIIDREQFEEIDTDNIVIIPFLSGHRDKDSLIVTFDHNYLDVYEKNDIQFLSQDTDPTEPKLSDFRCVIRLNEVESISLFDLQYYKDFQGKD